MKRSNDRGLWAIAGVAVAAAWMFRTRRRRPLARKLALVTGGSRGLGLAIAEQLARRGASVVICARDGAELEHAASMLASRGLDVHTRVADVRERDAIADMVADVERELGPIDILVNNAGVLHVGPATAMTIEDLRDAMETNFWGAVNVADAVLPSMLVRHTGQIVNIASIGGIAPIPWMLPYSASKSAILGWSQGLHHDLAREGIAVTTVAPWVMRTGGPINGTFKGSARKASYEAFALADLTPLLSIGVRAAARTIVRGIERRRAMVLVGLQSRVVALGNAIAPSSFSTILSWIAAVLPRSFTHVGARGAEIASELSPRWRAIAERSRARNNQPEIEPARVAKPAPVTQTVDDVANALAAR
jgi:short-subunit dehydrogenase